jgi:phosphate transport system substrate-binding protein
MLGVAALGLGLSLTACGTEAPYTHETVTLNFGGSTSVESIAKALTARFDQECKYFDASHNHTGSGDAYKRTQGADKDASTKLDVGFLSRDLKAEEAAKANTSGRICIDGIVAVVNNSNSVTNLTKAQLKSIYETETVAWSTYGSSLTTNIKKYSRDTTSGTRDGFFSALGYSDAVKDDTKIPGAIIASGNGDMITKVKGDANGIGYISFATLEGSGVKGLQFEGVTASNAAIVDGTYKLQRNFNYITRAEEDCTEAEWDVLEAFMLFLTSQEALTIVQANHGILTTSIASAPTWASIKAANADVAKLCA